MSHSTTRHQLSLAAAAVLALGTLGIAGTGAGNAAGAAPASSAADRRGAAVDGARKALDARPGAARDTATQKFAVTDVVLDADGSSHVRMNRTVHGLPVIGGDLVVHQAKGQSFDGVSQTLAAPLTLAVQPTVAKARAKGAAVAGKIADRIARLEVKGAPTLAIDATGASPVLVWQVLTGGRQADGTPSRMVSYVDAKSGKVLRREEQIVNVDGEGQGLYSGTVDISVTKSGANYTLTDAEHGNGTTTDAKNKTDSALCSLLGMGCASSTPFTSPDASFGNGSNANRESAAVDAHYGHAMTYDFYSDVLGRAGIFGDGSAAPSRVHYGSNYVNAFWDGEKMTYGDGDGTSYGPLVSLDVAGHEMSHGVTENTAGLTYSGESGGLNEATSDIFGTMVEFHAANANDPGDYYIGEEFDLANQEGLRRMDDPDADGVSINCYSSSAGDADVHYSSGIGNHFFYLLAEGSGAKTIGGKAHNSPTCDGSSVSGIGRDDASKIWFRALTVYMTSDTAYAGAREATLSAASDLYGANSTQRAAVASAWSAVSVG